MQRKLYYDTEMLKRMSEGKASDIRFLFYRYAFFLLRGKANGIREIFADLEAKLHEIVCRETANTERRSEKDLTKSDLIPWLRELESMLIRSTHHIRISESPGTEISLFKSVYKDARQDEWKYAVIRVENQEFSSL